MLLERRADSDRWAFIGGSVDLNESVTEAVQREVFEETGLRIDTFRLFGVISDPSRIIAYGEGRTVSLLTIVFQADVPNAELRLSAESRELRYFDVNELRGVRIAETHEAIRRRYLERPTTVFVD